MNISRHYSFRRKLLVNIIRCFSSFAHRIDVHELKLEMRGTRKILRSRLWSNIDVFQLVSSVFSAYRLLAVGYVHRISVKYQKRPLDIQYSRIERHFLLSPSLSRPLFNGKYVQLYANTHFGELVLAGVKFNTLPSTCLSHILWRWEKFQWQFGSIHDFVRGRLGSLCASTSNTHTHTLPLHWILYEYWWIEVSMNILCPLLLNVLLLTYTLPTSFSSPLSHEWKTLDFNCVWRDHAVHLLFSCILHLSFSFPQSSVWRHAPEKRF